MAAESVVDRVPCRDIEPRAFKPVYKQSEVGLIPEDWDIGCLDRFWTTTDCKHVTAHFVDNGFPVASIREVQSRFVDLSAANQTTQQFYDLLIEGARKPRAGDMVLSRNATVGEVAQVTLDHPPFAMGQDVCLLRKRSSKFSTDYLQSLFRSPLIASQISNAMTGSTFKRINVQQIKKFVIPFPKPDEQNAIAEALGDADDLIETLERILAKKRHLKHGATQDLLTGRRRLPSFCSLHKLKKTDIGLIPEDWETKELKALAAVTSGKRLPLGKYLTKRETTHPYVRVTDMRDGTVSLDNLMYVPEETYPSIRRYRIFKGDIFISVAGTLGIVGKIPPEIDGANLTENANRIWDIKCSQAYLLHVLKSPIIQKTIETLQTVGAQPKLALARIRNFVLPMPPTIAEQQAIGTVLTDMDSEINALEQKLAKAREIKQGMMQQLLTGQVRLI